MELTDKDIRLYFYCKDANRWWFESKQKISDIIESGKWPKVAYYPQSRDSKHLREIFFVISTEFRCE